MGGKREKNKEARQAGWLFSSNNNNVVSREAVSHSVEISHRTRQQPQQPMDFQRGKR